MSIFFARYSYFELFLLVKELKLRFVAKMTTPGGKRHAGGRPKGAKRNISGAPTRVSLRHKPRVKGAYSAALESEYERYGKSSYKRRRRASGATVSCTDEAWIPPQVDLRGDAIGRYDADMKEFELGGYCAVVDRSVSSSDRRSEVRDLVRVVFVIVLIADAVDRTSCKEEKNLSGRKIRSHRRSEGKFVARGQNDHRGASI